LPWQCFLTSKDSNWMRRDNWPRYSVAKLTG